MVVLADGLVNAKLSDQVWGVLGMEIRRSNGLDPPHLCGRIVLPRNLDRTKGAEKLSTYSVPPMYCDGSLLLLFLLSPLRRLFHQGLVLFVVGESLKAPAIGR